MNLSDVARISRLAMVMQLRDATFAPVALAAAKAGDQLLVGVSAHGSRIEVVMTYTPEAHAALAADAVAPTGTERLRVRLDGDASEVMFDRRGLTDPMAAVAELASVGMQESWLELVGSLCAIANGRIVGTARATDGRALIQIGYPARDRDTEAILVEGLDELGAGLGVSAAQRTLFRRIHPQLGKGGEIVVTTRSTLTAISSHLAISYPIADWQTAVRLAGGLVFNDSEGKEVSRRLGLVAGALAADRLTGIELVLGPHEPPDVVVWANIVPR